MEKIIARRLAYYTEIHYLLHADQIGGRPKYLAIDTVLALVHDAD